jgi:hypothetical protein
MTRLVGHQEIAALLGVYAIDAIADRSERAAVAAHLETCAECREEVGAHLETLAELTPGPAPVPERSWNGVARAIEASDDPDLADSLRGVVIPIRRRPFVAIGAPVAAAAAAVLITFAVMRGDGGLGSPTLNVRLRPAAQAVTVTGSASLYAPDTPSGRLVIDLRKIPDAPAGHHYEVWVLRPGKGVEMEPVGAFTPSEGTARLVLGLPGPGTYVAVDISVQEDGGPPEHSGKSLAGASLQ